MEWFVAKGYVDTDAYWVFDHGCFDASCSGILLFCYHKVEVCFLEGYVNSADNLLGGYDYQTFDWGTKLVFMPQWLGMVLELTLLDHTFKTVGL